MLLVVLPAKLLSCCDMLPHCHIHADSPTSDLSFCQNIFYVSISHYPFLSVAQEQRLHRLFKSAARAVCKSPPWTSTAPLLNRMLVRDLQVFVHLNMFCFIWQCLHDSCSTLFQSFFRCCALNSHSRRPKQLACGPTC